MAEIALGIKYYIKNIGRWIKANPLEFWSLIALLFLGSFLRLYKIDQYMTFLGDEGRDVIIVRRFLTEFHPPLIGPGTSIGQMYLGPMYYYFMAPALLIGAFSPVGPAVEVAMLGIATIWFVWYVTRIWFNRLAAFVAAFLYSISPVVIIYSRSSWNPNIMPFFALLSIFSIWNVWKRKNYNWLVVLGFAYAAVLQSHYLGLLLAPTLFVFWTLSLLESKKDKKLFVKKTLAGAGLFAVLMSPLLMFDARHGWINSKALYTFFTVRQTTVSIRPWTALPKIPETLNTINTSLIGASNKSAGLAATVILIVSVVVLLFTVVKNKRFRLQTPYSEFSLLIVWLGFALIGFGLYKQNIYDHYFGFVFPVPFVLIGVISSVIYKYGRLGKIAAAVMVLYFAYVNFANNPLRYKPNNQMARAYNVAQKIRIESENKPFNLGVIAERNYEDGYKYFLLKDGAPVVNIDSQVENSIKDQLFAVCELPHEKCDPTHSPTAAIANFGWSKIESQWEVDGVIIYKLVHSSKKQ